MPRPVYPRWNSPTYPLEIAARGSVVGWGTMLQARRSPVRVSDEVDFFNLPSFSSRTMVLGSTQPLTEMSTSKLPGGKKRPARRAENVGASTSCNPKGLHGRYRDNFTFYLTNWKLGWVGSRAGRNDVKNRKFLTLQGLELRTLRRPARSQSLYRLRYPG
jgi:hypothetical protein